MQAQPPPDPTPPTGTILYCNCRQLCDGVLQIINDRRKWNRHAKYREGPAEFFERRRMDAAAQAAQAGGSAPRAPAQPVPVRTLVSSYTYHSDSLAAVHAPTRCARPCACSARARTCCAR